MYNRPVIINNIGFAEGVYMASGDGKGDFTVNVRYDGKDGGKDSWSVNISYSGDTGSTEQKVVVKYPADIKDFECADATSAPVSAGNTITFDLSKDFGAPESKKKIHIKCVSNMAPGIVVGDPLITVTDK